MKAASIITALGLCAVLAACSESELHTAMEGMGDNFKAMQESPDREALMTQLAEFQAYLDNARRQKVAEEDQAVFDEGLKKVNDMYAELVLAADTNNTATLENLLGKLKQVRKEYHEKLGVK